MTKATNDHRFGAAYPSSKTILNAESIAGVRPLDIVEFIADNAAGATLDTSLVGEEHRPIRLRSVAGGGTAVDALLPFTLETRQPVDDTDMRALRINSVRVDAQLFLKPGSISYSVDNHALTQLPVTYALTPERMVPSLNSALASASGGYLAGWLPGVAYNRKAIRT